MDGVAARDKAAEAKGRKGTRSQEEPRARRAGTDGEKRMMCCLPACCFGAKWQLQKDGGEGRIGEEREKK